MEPAVVIPVKLAVAAWPVINGRRCELIDKTLITPGVLDAAEQVELEQLQAYADWFQGTFAPRDESKLREMEILLERKRG